MEKLRFSRIMSLIVFSLLLLSSCENELHMTLPEGPQGPDGLSAYEVWVRAVESGTIQWDKNNTDENNFFLYLKGQDGKDGAAGKSAFELWVEAVGKGIDNPHKTGTNWDKSKTSMQDFWYFLTGAKGQDGSTPVIGVNGNWFINDKDTGILARGENGNDGNNGSVITIGDNGNWFIDGVDTNVLAFGTAGQDGKDGTDGKDGQDGTAGQDGKDGTDGKDGQDGTAGQDGKDGVDGQSGKSAYQLWLDAVAQGLDDPHNLGSKWDKTKISTQDFWRYLRGEDGEDGTPGEPGTPGKDIVIIKGKANVISQYSVQEYSEFVRFTDGGVAFIVYDDAGNPAPNAKVKGLPSIQDPTKIYTTDASGLFVVPKEDLPVDKDVADRFGAVAEVEYTKSSTGTLVKETSAPNCYVPNRIFVRLRSTYGSVSLTSTDMYLFTTVERLVDQSKGWENIPSYLGNLNQKIRAYELKDMDDPTSYSSLSQSLDYDYTVNISSLPTVSIPRLTKKSEYCNIDFYLWDGNEHYFNLVLDSYYGEKPHANIVIKMAPVQYMPIIKNVEAYTYNEGLDIFSEVKGIFDFGDNYEKIDSDLIFKAALKKEYKTTASGDGYYYYYPEKVDINTIVGLKDFKINIYTSTHSANNSLDLASISSPGFSVTTPHQNSNVALSYGSTYFKQYGGGSFSIGRLTYDKKTGTCEIQGVKNSYYNFPDIAVQVYP